MPNTNWPTSKELYMMNGGNKLYIHKDGFGDIYNATAEEEREWAKEMISNDLAKIDTEENPTGLRFAVEGLLFHDYPNLEALLIPKMEAATPIRKIVLATALWKIYKYKKSYEVIYQQFLQEPKICLDDFFFALIEFKNNMEAFHFLLECLEGKDETLYSKAYTTITMWSYSGVPKLRANELLERLDLDSRVTKKFKPAVEELKKIMFKKITKENEHV